MPHINFIARFLTKSLFIVCFVLLLSACPKRQPEVTLKGDTFVVEIADNDQSRARGMMFRESLATDRGMLFVFPDEAMRAFWMHNCKIPLDILYFDANLKLVGSALNVPPCNLAPSQCPNYPSQAPAKYVLEISAGLATKMAVQNGDTLELNL